MTHRVKRPPVQWAGCSTKEMCFAAGVSAERLVIRRAAIEQLLAAARCLGLFRGDEQIEHLRLLRRGCGEKALLKALPHFGVEPRQPLEERRR